MQRPQIFSYVKEVYELEGEISNLDQKDRNSLKRSKKVFIRYRPSDFALPQATLAPEFSSTDLGSSSPIDFKTVANPFPIISSLPIISETLEVVPTNSEHCICEECELISFQLLCCVKCEKPYKRSFYKFSKAEIDQPPKTLEFSTKVSGRKPKPRWQKQDLLVYMALSSLPGQKGRRNDIIKAAVELDMKISKEQGLPRTFSGKTPMNSASACLTNDHSKLFIKYTVPEDKFLRYKLSFPTNDFEFAVTKYKQWEADIYKIKYPKYFGETKSPSNNDNQPTTAESGIEPATNNSLGSDETEQTAIITPEALSNDFKSMTFPLHDSIKTGGGDGFVLSLQDSSSLTKVISNDPQVVLESAITTTPEFISSMEDKVYQVPTCWQDILEVKPSSIEGAGLGLFAKRFIPKRSILGYYFGTPMTEYDYDKNKDNVGLAANYSIMYDPFILDGTDPDGQPFTDPQGPLYCPFHFMNEHPDWVNMAFHNGPQLNQIECTSIFDIPAGQELFVFYGREYVRDYWR